LKIIKENNIIPNKNINTNEINNENNKNIIFEINGKKSRNNFTNETNEKNKEIINAWGII